MAPVVPPALSRFVDDVRTVASAPGRPLDVERLPDGRTTLVFRVLEQGRRGDVTVAGPRTRAHFKRASGVAGAVVLTFKPGFSVSLFGVAAHALTDRIVPLDDLWGSAGRDVCAALLAAPTLPVAIDWLAKALAARAAAASESASARLVRRAVSLLEVDGARVDQVARQLGVTDRHLRRAFQEGVGIGPKAFARSVRLQRVVRAAATSHDWARTAVEAGYYDQAHLIADFRELVGLTPGAFARRAADLRR